MLAPIDKLESGANRIIQVEVTRRCDVFTCSNCTRLLPFRVDDRDMTPACFEEAVRSLSDWPGVVAMFGGNPCVHPQFPELCRIMAEHIAPDHRGLWTNHLRGHGQVVSQTFPIGAAMFNLNVHGDAEAAAEMRHWLPGVKIWGEKPSRHAPILLDYADYGIEYDQWVRLREKCDINRNWSAVVMQREGKPHAYFCEVAGALDGIRGENHGIPLAPDWWKWRMSHYGDQVLQCCDRGCGVPLRQVGHWDTADTYDVSPSFVPLTVKGASRVALSLSDSLGERTHEVTDYQGLRG